MIFASTAPRDFAEAWPGDETLIFLEEPWATEQATPDCREALRSRYEGLVPRTMSTEQQGPNLDQSCHLFEGRWGWTRDKYIAAAKAAAAAEGMTLIGTVGVSFGAWRTAALWQDVTLDYAIVSSPPTLDWTGPTYIAERTAAVLEVIARNCSRCDGSRRSAEIVVDAAAEALDRTPIKVPLRSPTVVGSDVYAAALAIGYLTPAKQTVAARAFERPTGRRNATAIGQLSDSLMQRYGEIEQSPAALAYLDELCPALGNFAQEREPGGRLARWFARFHASCAQAPQEPHLSASLAAGRVPQTLCVASIGDDVVTPVRATASWTALPVRRRLTVRIAHGSHGDARLAAQCHKMITQTVQHGLRP